MKSIRNLGQRLNPTQRIIVAVSVAIVFLIISFTIAEDTGWSGAFDMEDTWAIWLVFAAVTGYFEFHLFSDKKD